ncbi:hydrogenase accessory protein HypB [Xylanimonas allomyrinae]|uniref:Hydrogenase accessory protein HypB n=1 Tax=Xylanimonas allomyrinae TaxID=2509459 RepID=A0A4P6F1C8_9MICO|nr:hydrogenase nickel incorporation protein HypB [Xylanimonas allomyrinae]QAY64138.1 hydrogenase accessory protein HypB [Xylanimonas allomyrinae]
MGRFHRHDDGDGHHEHPHEHLHEHLHEHGHPHEHSHEHSHEHGQHHDVPEPASRHEDVGDHTGYATGSDRIAVLERIFDENDHCAAHNRADFDAAGVTVVNVMSSPGAGKTEVLARTLAALDASRVGIIEGDVETALDADRLAAGGARVSLLNTADGFGGECHLDAPMVRHALSRLPLDGLDLVFVENVGNLVCPAEFAVGEHLRAMVYAVTEGEEKPAKYPVMFRSADVVLVNKTDLLPHLDFSLDRFYEYLARVNPQVRTIEVSARTGEGIDAWVAWLRENTAAPLRKPLGA